MNIDEGHYPAEWELDLLIEHCFDHKRHEPHFHVPPFIDPDETSPDFLCGGWPRKVVNLFDYA